MSTFGFSDGALVEVLDPATLKQAQTEKRFEVEAIARASLEAVVSKYPALEKATWTKKRDQAEAYQRSGDPADCPALAAEAMATARILGGGEPGQELLAQTLLDLTAKILLNAEQIEALQAQVIGWRSAMAILIDGLPTISAVQDFSIQPPLQE